MRDRPLHLVTDVLFSSDGESLLTGGAERWCRDLAISAAIRGFNVTVYQRSSVPFSRPLADSITVVGVRSSLSAVGALVFSRWLHRNSDATIPVIYVSPLAGMGHRRGRAVAINHGIWWDGDFQRTKLALITVLHRRLLKVMEGII